MDDTTYGNAIRILLANTLSLGLAFLWVDKGDKTRIRWGIAQQNGTYQQTPLPLTKGVFILELGTHCDL